MTRHRGRAADVDVDAREPRAHERDARGGRASFEAMPRAFRRLRALGSRGEAPGEDDVGKAPRGENPHERRRGSTRRDARERRDGERARERRACAWSRSGAVAVLVAVAVVFGTTRTRVDARKRRRDSTRRPRDSTNGGGARGERVLFRRADVRRGCGGRTEARDGDTDRVFREGQRRRRSWSLVRRFAVAANRTNGRIFRFGARRRTGRTGT